MTTRILLVLAIFCAIVNGRATAQTIGYAGAIDNLAASCGKDIDRYCKTVNLGGGQMLRCLDQNQANVSTVCKASISALRSLLQRRAAARAAVPRLCERDILRFCNGIEPGDGNLMDCFSHVKQNISAQCRQAVIDAGYTATLASASAPGPINLTSSDLVNSLQSVDAPSTKIDVAALQRLVIQTLRAPTGTSVGAGTLFDQLNNLPQFTIAVEFDFNSARIRSDSFRAVGLMADALYHPYLQGYRFLIVGNTDAKGSREYNLKLSQERADAIRNALINPLGIAPGRLAAVGFGKEHLLNQHNPEAAENRRVQLINIGAAQ